MVDHAVSFVLTDNDMKWPAWSAAYKFILEYWGKDYRAPGERAGPVQPPALRRQPGDLGTAVAGVFTHCLCSDCAPWAPTSIAQVYPSRAGRAAISSNSRAPSAASAMAKLPPT